MDKDEEKAVSDIENFMLYCHEWAFWNVQLGYAGIPPEFKPFYITLKMEKDPIPIDVLTEHLPSEDVSEIVLQHVIIREDVLYITNTITEDIIFHLSKRMDYLNKMKLVDKGMADLFWDSEKGEPVFKVKKSYLEKQGSSESSESD